MARWVSMSAMQGGQGGHDRCHLVPVLWLPAPNLGHGGHDFSKHTEAAGHVVSGHVVRDESEERRQADGPGIGRIRMRAIQDASAGSLHGFVMDCIEPGSTLHTDGWQGYVGLDKQGFQREVTVLRGRRKEASELMPRVHRVASLLKRWLLGTHQGAVSHEHLPYYLDEFTFRFNRRRSKSRGKLFSALCNRRSTLLTQPMTPWLSARSRSATDHHPLWPAE